MLGLAPLAGAPQADDGDNVVTPTNQAALVEANDVMAGSGGVSIPGGSAALTEANDIMTGSGGGRAGRHDTVVVRRALTEVLAEIHATTTLRRALVKDGGIPSRTTVAVRRMLVNELIPLLTTGMVRRTLGAVVPCTTRWTRIWRLYRTDGVVHRLTSHDLDLIYAGQTYTHCGGLSPSATEGSNEVGGAGNMELKGAISSGEISAEDLGAGRLDSAEFEEWEVPWDGTPESPHLIQMGTWGKVEYDPTAGFSVEVLGDGAKLQQRSVIQVVTPSCRWSGNVEDPRCGVDVPSRTVTGVVTRGLGTRSFEATDRPEADDFFAFGKVTFTSGANAGVQVEIKGNSAGVFTLWPRLAALPQAGDTYSMFDGCDQLKPTCIDKYANLLNFGGYSDVPGADALAEIPDAK